MNLRGKKAAKEEENKLLASASTLPDYPALNWLAEALWGSGDARGAAVMVGAGFSRNSMSATPHVPPSPLWWNFTESMMRRLGREPGSYADPLRLAEEFRSEFGQPALDALIRTLVCDDQREPGIFHAQLLRLPWTDVLTTNWDTLLERTASRLPERNYEVVRTLSDVARTRPPRIVKLHGSLPANGPYIFAEEDYRTYPRLFAPFVNLARQVLLENELCLLGFSGDDPNFLQWAGWVRDELGPNARRIHLVGVLNLTQSKRKFLESRNVVPIDLAPIVQHLPDADKNAVAVRSFLAYLNHSQPSDPSAWPAETTRGKARDMEKGSNHFDKLRKDDAYTRTTLVQLSALWRDERKSYPGWLVCPSQIRQMIQHDLDFVTPTAARRLSILEPVQRARFVYELLWRADTVFADLHSLSQVAENLLIAEDSSFLSNRKRLQLALILLRVAREKNDQDGFKRWQAWIETNANGDQDAIAAANYEQCLRFRDIFDLRSLHRAVRSIAGQDPTWLMRRAALHSELGEYRRTEELLRHAILQLRERQSKDRRSIWVLSRQAWALMTARATRFSQDSIFTNDTELSHLINADNWPRIFKDVQSDPWEELHAFDREFDKHILARDDNRSDILPLFEAGAYTEYTSFADTATEHSATVARDYRHLMDVTGFPARLDVLSLGQERGAHPRLDRPEGMLDGLAPQRHLGGIIVEPVLDALLSSA